ncbi:hypothetical protein BN2476_560034 [Paraburkholderia piptadeniae]|uniref:Uncharacterized protein n=1 Tax=Paraburkholderia piptadeniae TaxID=1701573 RepID=A0A1N7SIN7_9BURK|nr:hypothetical protein BN2476_560034 [Paraburkholderia piptadeniae]
MVQSEKSAVRIHVSTVKIPAGTPEHMRMSLTTGQVPPRMLHCFATASHRAQRLRNGRSTI